MRKFLIKISAVALLVLLIRLCFVYFDIDWYGDTDVTYKSINQFGVTYEVPNGCKESYLSSGDEYYYESRRNQYKLTVRVSEAKGVTPSQYVVYMKELFITGSIKGNGYTRTITDESITNKKCTTADVVYKNGIEMGNIIEEYDHENDGKTRNLTDQVYGFKVKDTLVEFDFACETKDVEKYQEMVNHIVNSIKVQ